MRRRRSSKAALAVVMVDGAPHRAWQRVPVLRYAPPVTFCRRASALPEHFASDELRASLQVYPFRPFTGDLERQFQRTLLEEWIEPAFRQDAVAGPTFAREEVLGASQALQAQFADGAGARHVRVLIQADGEAAIVDVSAEEGSWPRAVPAVAAMLASINVTYVRQTGSR